MLTADPESLASAATHLAGIADRLGAPKGPGGPGGPGASGEPATLLAPVPQAAAFTAAMARVRGEQATVMSGFSGFYRSSAESLSSTATALRRGEDAAAARFAGMGTGALR
ncbi:MAG: hypothetical protein L0J74_03465 [Corynebacterium sp.]|uniref:hypothetical protein n=1 Tax=Corynebacterium TaxID=1716 RepID=UPI002647EB57|nr:hypothetical protein [Corynebacterium sp.]MDN5722835.1 hypothetical protein [Corynebacterium sp.]MDN6283082.1 hypothetical protein [Corynebacterium sp.]MDN6304853.1 hypothetical protein [Corynebacterium sp.]MDN6352296.1 hypothetical protein [Corynebacterium sp.]MDN6368570.1 hypothetical protein [Corynebacterium sp.]